MKTKKKIPKVFLGGTCNGSTWRDDIISQLKIDYFNPVVDDWNEEAQQEELRQREECDFMLYVITPLMSGVYSIAEVVDDSNKHPEKTILCYRGIDVTETGEIIDFNEEQRRSLKAVANMVGRNGAKFFLSTSQVSDYLNNKLGK